MKREEQNFNEFKNLIESHRGAILRICRAYSRSKEEKEDMYQDVCINIWKGLPSFREEAAIGTWIYRIAINTALLHVRKRKRDILHASKELPDVPAVLPKQQDPRIKELYRAIDTLSPGDKAIILLYLEDKSYEEISNIIGINKKHLSVKLVRIKAKLEKAFSGP